MADETTQAMSETAQHDMPVAMTVGPSGRLLVATAAGRMWEWDGKVKRFRPFAVLPGSHAEEELVAYHERRAQAAAQAAEQQPSGSEEKAQEA